MAEGQAKFPQMEQEVQAGYIATITKRDETVAYGVGKERMSAFIETMEILANPAAMKAIREYEARKTKFVEIENISD